LSRMIDRILKFLMDRPGEWFDDGEIQKALGIKNRAQVNSRCRKLADEGKILRSRIGGRLKNSYQKGLGLLEPTPPAHGQVPTLLSNTREPYSRKPIENSLINYGRKSKYDEAWKTIFEKFGGVDFVFQIIRSGKIAEIPANELSKYGSRINWKGTNIFSHEGVIQHQGAHLNALKNILCEHITKKEKIVCSMRICGGELRLFIKLFDSAKGGESRPSSHSPGPSETPQRKMARREDIESFYQLLDQLSTIIGGTRVLSKCDGKMDWPKRGVYFFFEPGEYREDNETPRVVRVGTHAISLGSESTLWGRLRSHRGFLTGRYAGGGNHRGSIFRKLVGYAILEKGGHHSDFPTWGQGQSATPSVRNREHPIEVEVSRHIREMPFLWLDVNDEPGPTSDRKTIEKGAIALLSNRNKGEIIDPSSENWMGRWCPKGAVRESGLWNSQHTDKKYDANFLRGFKSHVEKVSPIQGKADDGPTKKTLILIPCSGRKREGGNQLYQRVPGRRMLDVLSENYKDMLLSSRQEVAKAIEESAGPDLGSPVSEGGVTFLPAFKRYDGNLYRQITERTWENLRRSNRVDVVIVSGLYGLVFWDEPIRYYNVMMNQSPWYGRRLCTWWKRHGLPEILASLIMKIGYSDIHDFLSTHYRVAVNDYQRLNPSIGAHTHNYPGLGSGADYHRGRDINDLILKLTRVKNE